MTKKRYNRNPRGAPKLTAKLQVPNMVYLYPEAWQPHHLVIQGVGGTMHWRDCQGYEQSVVQMVDCIILDMMEGK